MKTSTFRWDAKYETGLEEVDTQHRALVDIINRLGGLRIDGANNADIATTLNFLADYAKHHFASEEAMMKSIGVSREHYETHCRTHQLFFNQVSRIVEEARGDATVATDRILHYLVKWLAFHILGQDTEMTVEIKALQGGVPPREARYQAVQHVMRSTEVLFDAFNALYDDLGASYAELAVAYSKLRQSSEAQLKDAQRLSHVGSWERDLTNHHLLWSDETYRIFERDPAALEASHEAFINSIHPDDREAAGRAYRDSVTLHTPYEITYRLVVTDGRIKYVQERGETFYDPDGRPLRSIGTIQDLTQRVLAEEELRESEARYERAVNGANDGIWEWNLVTDEEYLSPRWKQLLGYENHELPNRRSSFVEQIHPEDQPQAMEAVRAHLEARKPYEVELRMRSKSGEYRWFCIRGQAVWDPQGQPLQMSGFMTDVTERKQISEALVAARWEAERANLAKSRFLATMSHEIRTPLNGILGMAQLLLLPNLSDTERQGHARTIISSGWMLLTLLDDILDLSKVEAGKVQLESTTFDPTQILRDTQALFEETAHAKALRLEVGCFKPSDQHYWGDSHRLRQMLSNLVNNAIKFTAQGQVRIEAREVERDTQAATLEFVVSDTGIGIPEGVQARLFEPFSQADTSTTRQYGGTGLGLSIVQGLAKLMGGYADFESEQGKGSSFWFRIRADLVPAGRDLRQTGRSRHVNEPGATPAQPIGRVLVVEDNSVNVKVIEAMLKRFGVTVTLARDGQQALEAVMEGDASDLILMDLQMPVMDGFTAAERIRQWEMENGKPRHPIIALTADAYEESRQRCLAAGMDSVLTKPIRIETLKAELDRWLRPSTGSGRTV
ncbi:two-component system, sensor histidine kinase [Gammaproteobacteria bacterium]